MDLGCGVIATRTCYRPDRVLNPDAGPDVEWLGLILEHRRPDDGTRCRSSIVFDLPEASSLLPSVHRWQVEQWDPLTLSPSVLCRARVHTGDPARGYGPECGWHGFIRNGLWVAA
jgi:hypothetical protein